MKVRATGRIRDAVRRRRIQARSSFRSTASTRKPRSARAAAIFGTLRKMSTNQTSSTYQAVDKLRPAEAFTLEFPGTPARLNLFLQTPRPLQFRCRHRQRQRLDRRCRPWMRTCTQGLVYDYYFKRFGRHGMDDREPRSTASSIRSRDRKPIGSRRTSSTPISTTPSICCDGLLVFGDGDGRIYNYLAGALRRRRARMDARRHRVHLAI